MVTAVVIIVLMVITIIITVAIIIMITSTIIIINHCMGCPINIFHHEAAHSMERKVEKRKILARFHKGLFSLLNFLTNVLEIILFTFSFSFGIKQIYMTDWVKGQHQHCHHCHA